MMNFPAKKQPRRRQPSSSTDKKTSSSATFRLVHRSQTDPLIVDQSAPEYVLQPTNRNARMIQESSKVSVKPRCQLLRATPHFSQGHSDESTIRLPSNMFESDEKLPVGLLNMQAERSLDLSNFDEDVAEVDAALDGGKSSIVADIDLAELDDALPDLIAEDDDAASVSTLTPDHEVEETRSRFTEYSLTSSVIRRNAGLTLIDERFEKVGCARNEKTPILLASSYSSTKSTTRSNWDRSNWRTMWLANCRRTIRICSNWQASFGATTSRGEKSGNFHTGENCLIFF